MAETAHPPAEPVLDVAARPRTQLAAAHALAPYWWAASAASGRSVLDVCCGLADGTEILATAAPRELVAVDRSEAVVEAARARLGDRAEGAVGTPLSLPFEDGRFDLVVCFDALPEGEELAPALAELSRVLAPKGVLLTALPEPAPAGVGPALGERFAQTAEYRQAGWLASGVLATAHDGEVPVPVEGVRVGALGADSSQQAIARCWAASDGPLPRLDAGLLITGTADVRDWERLYAEQQDALARLRAEVAEARERTRELGELRAELRKGERVIAQLPGLELERHALERDLEAMRIERDRAFAEAGQQKALAERAQSILARMQASPSWRATKPLRALKHLLR